jgi:hypothetical protein
VSTNPYASNAADYWIAPTQMPAELERPVDPTTTMSDFVRGPVFKGIMDSQYSGLLNKAQSAGRGTWANGVYQNGWATYNLSVFGPARYMKDDDGTVHLEGLVATGTIGTTIFTLPPGYRPEYQQLVATSTNPNVYARCDITQAGFVQASTGSNVWFSLDGISFKAAA